MTQIFSLLNIISSIVILFLGYIVFRRSDSAKSYKGFFLLCSTSALWLGMYGLAYAYPRYADTLFSIGFVGVILEAVVAYQFVVEYLQLKNERKYLRIAYVVAFIFLASHVLFNNVINRQNFFYWGPYPKASYLHPYMVVAISAVVLRFLYLLYNARLRADIAQNDSDENKRLFYVFMGLGIFSLSALDFIANYGYPFIPLGSVVASGYTLMIAIGIIRYKLMDVDVFIRRTFVFAGIFTFVYGTFSFVTMLSQDAFHKYLGWNQWVAMAPTVLIITLALRPLDVFLTNVTEKFLFQKKINYRDLLRTFTNEVLTILDLQKLTEQTVHDLVKIIKLESAAIILYEPQIKKYRIVSAFGIKDLSIEFGSEDHIVHFMKETSQPIIKDKSADLMDGHSMLRDQFRSLNAGLCVPVVHHDELLGFLTLGMKKSGEDYTQEDIDILSTLARTLGIAIANAQLFDQLSKTQAEAAQREKMAVIGTLAAGINHEICNPLGIVRGQCEMFLLNLRDGIYDARSKEDITKISTEIMEKVIKETDRATAITKKLSGFAKPAKKVESEAVDVEKEADEVMGLLGHDLKLSNIAFTKEFAADFPKIYADKRQIQEVLFNIIRNASQAMDKRDGQIRLVGEFDSKQAIIKISDNGSGIPADKVGQIFNPFFTTKEPGKGTGLGLFIVRQVVERNKGTISVESQEGVGTTFTLTFPTQPHAEPTKMMAA